MKFKREYELILLEIITILISTVVYKVIAYTQHFTIGKMVSILIAYGFNYIVCTKFLFKRSHTIKRLGLFGFFSIIGLLVKKFFLPIIFRYLLITEILPISRHLFIVLYNFIIAETLLNQEKITCVQKLKNSVLLINDIWNHIISLKGFNIVFKVLPRNIFMFMFLVGSLYYGFLFIEKNDGIVVYRQNVTDSISEPFLAGDEYEIRFDDIEIEYPVNRVGILFATYNRVNTTNFKIQLYDEKNQIVSEKVFNARKIKDARYYYYPLPKVEPNELHNYHLKLSTSDATIINCVSVFMNSKDNSAAISLEQYHGVFTIKHALILCYILIFLVISYFVNKRDKLTPLKFYVLMLVYMIPAMFIYPPLEAPDEPVHLMRTINLSQNWLKTSEVSDMKVPENFNSIAYSTIQVRDMVISFKDIQHAFTSTKNHTITRMFAVNGISSGVILGYIGSAIFYKVADIFTNSPLILFWAGRLGNLLIAFYLVYKAIKVCPDHKRLILFIAMFPMFIQQMFSYTYDSILNASCLLVFAYSLAVCKGTINLDWKLKLKLIALLSIIASIKIIYLPVAILLLFPAKKKLKDNKSKFLYYAILIIGIFLVYYIVKNNFFVSFDGHGVSGGVSTGNRKIDYLLSNPLRIFSIAFNTLRINRVFYLQSLFGYFTWYKFSLSDFTILAYTLFSVALVFSEKNQIFNYKNKKDIVIKKIIMILAVGVSLAAVFGAMYLYWSPYKATYVSGVQGRYFLPMIPLIAFIFIPKKNKWNINDNVVYTFINIVMIQYMVYILTYFY